jgi:hypothetical protein
LIALSAASSAPARQPPETAETSTPHRETQRWKGVVSLPGMALAFSVDLDPEGGTISIPLQGVKGLPLRDVTSEGRSMSFALAPPGTAEVAWAKFHVTVAEDDRSAEGTLKQAGQAFPVSMTRLAEGESIEARRPQTPSPPHPYATREVTYRNDAAGIALAGTLAIPEGSGPHPAVVFLSGSGPQDRDETILEHKPFAVLADHLARHGIASLRSDDRGVGGSSGSVLLCTQEDFAADALAAVEFLKAIPEIDADRIGLLGHSEGGGVAPLAASRSESVRFLVLLAGTGLPGRDVMRLQGPAMMRAEGPVDEAAVEEADLLHRALTDAFLTDTPAEQRRAAIRALTHAQSRIRGQPVPEPAMLEQMISQQMITLNTPWMKSFLVHDPREALRKVRTPVLALNGSLDTQVTPRDNLPAIEGALKVAGNTDVTVRELPGLNHLFQTAKTGSPSEYSEIEETLSPTLLDEVTSWLERRMFPDR